MENQTKNIIKEIRAAIKEEDVRKIKSLLGLDQGLLSMITVSGTWLHVAAAQGRLEIVKILVSLGADVNAKGGVLGGSPLNEAAAEGHLEIVKYLLSCGAKMDVSEPERNPLFSAIYGGHMDVVKLLIDRGIDVHVKYSGPSMNNMDPLAFAQERGQTEIAKLLAEL